MSEGEKVSLNRSIGGQNRHTFFCSFHEQRRFYGACLQMIDMVKGGWTSDEDDPTSCSSAIRRKRCPALIMREEEVERGEAVYYAPLTGTLDRPLATQGARVPVDKTSASYLRGRYGAGNVPGLESKPASKPAKPAKPKDMTDVMAESADMTAAVNRAAARELVDKPPETKKQAPSASSAPSKRVAKAPGKPASKGPSMLDIARQMLAKQKENTHD